MKKKTTLEELVVLYSAINEVCEEYVRTTDRMSLTIGFSPEETYSGVSDELREMIDARQRFFSYKNKVFELIKKEIEEEMKKL